MQKVGLPPISSGIQISTIASREPPSRSWSRYKKLLIDNPKDANLLQRQKLWNFQKLNRGAFRSQITSLPDIPYRVKQNTVEKRSVGVQVNLSGRYGTGLRVLFPNLTGTKTDPPQVDDNSDSEDENTNRTDDDEFEYEEDFEDDSSIEDPGLEFETVVKKKDIGTMTIPRREKPARRKERRKRARDRDSAAVKKDKKSILLNTNDTPRAPSPKAVSFALDTARDEDEIGANVPKIELEYLPPITREQSIRSLSSGGSYVKLPLENIGHSSQPFGDPQSVLDYLSGNRTDRSSKMTDASLGKTPRRRNKPTDPEADRVWFEKIVGDKEIVDVATYESFARTRPNTECQSDSANERIIDFSRVYVRKNFTPRVNDEFPQYHSVVAKDTQNTQPKKQPPPTINKGRGQRRGLIGIGKSY